MKKQVDLVLRKLFSESTMVGIMIVAGVLLLALLTFPERAVGISNYLIPLFITAICIQIYLIHGTLKDIHGELKDIQDKVSDDDFSFQSFPSGKNFDNYLAYRLDTVHEMKVIHISSSNSSQKYGRRYHEILDAFVRREDRRFIRIFCDTDNLEIFKWIKQDLDTYKELKYFIHFLPHIFVGRIRTIGVMILDEEEVCLGGGYDGSYEPPTISIRHKQTVQFFLNYFAALLLESRRVRSNVDNTDLAYINKRIEELEKPVGQGES